MGGAHDVLSVACLPFHHAGVGFVVLPLICLPPESNGTVGRFRPAFRPRKLDRRQRREAEPTGYDPATSHVTGGRAADCATAPSRAVRAEWHGERMTTSPGSRVSCETATRPPATARRSGSCVLRHTHEPSVVKELAPPETPIAPPGFARRWGDLSSRGERGWTYAAGSGPSIPASALHFVFISSRSRPRLEVTTYRRLCRPLNQGSTIPSSRLGEAGHTPGFTAKAARSVRASRNTREVVIEPLSPISLVSAPMKSGGPETQKVASVVFRVRHVMPAPRSFTNGTRLPA